LPLKTDRTADLSRYADWLGWLGWLRERGGGDPDVRAVFIGGSAVTGGYDDHSDLDVEVLATPGQAVPAYPQSARGGPARRSPGRTRCSPSSPPIVPTASR
jgi:hypothetical protein